MTDKKPLASISLDLDNKWSYMKTHGDAGWEEYPTYLPALIPYVLEILKQRQLKITFFVVGLDAAQDINKNFLRSLSDNGHEIGNHSYNHEPWLHKYSYDKVLHEIGTTDELIKTVTGYKPIGFRGPGFNFSRGTLQALSELGYQYDASLLPTFMGPIARMYYLWTAKLDKSEKEKREALFGSWKLGMFPIKPFLWELPQGHILEIPVTTMPIFKVPIHLSYVIYLATYSRKLAEVYIKMSLRLCRICKVEPSFLLHPLDFLDKNDAPELKFFPGMNLSREVKKSIVEMVLEYFQNNFEVVPMKEHASRILDQNPKTLDTSVMP